MISSLHFASCHVYSPTGIRAASVRSRALCARLKSGDAAFLRSHVGCLRAEISARGELAEFFRTAPLLVPVPGCLPRCSGATLPNERLAAELVRAGLGSRTWAVLRRARAVRKSATAPPGVRPTVQTHYASFALEDLVREPGLDAVDMLLIDDVITKGRTLLAAAARLHDAYPQARIRAFVLLRTMGLTPEVDRLLDPCIGEIRWSGGDALRVP